MEKRPWSPEDKERLRRLHEETGAGPVGLAVHFPGRSLNSVRGQYEQLELGKKSTVQRVDLGTEHQRIFRQMLRTHAATMSPAELLRHWNERIAPQVGAVFLGRGYVDYWLTKLRLRRPDGAAKAAGSTRRRKTISRKLRLRGERKALEQFKRLRTRRDQLFIEQPDHPRVECPRCHEGWPVTAEFYKLQRSKGREERFDLAACKLCRKQRRRTRYQHDADGIGTRDLAIDRRAAARAAIALAEQRARDEALARATEALNRDMRMEARECVRCEGRFPLTDEYFARHTGGNKALKHLCVYCSRTVARQKRNAKADRDTRLLGILAKEQRALTRKGRIQEARERRRRFIEQAREEPQGPRLQCPKCFQVWPKTIAYWTTHRYETQSGPSECLRVSMCRCCWNERCVQGKKRSGSRTAEEEGED